MGALWTALRRVIALELLNLAQKALPSATSADREVFAHLADTLSALARAAEISDPAKGWSKTPIAHDDVWIAKGTQSADGTVKWEEPTGPHTLV